MQTKFSDGSVLVVGNCAKDAQLEHVGQNGKRVCKVGLSVGKRTPEGGGEPATVWANVVAWEKLAEVLSAAKKGDPVAVVGRLKSREYNGKTYTDVVAEWVDVCSPQTAPTANREAPQQMEDFPLLSGDDDLPFL